MKINQNLTNVSVSFPQIINCWKMKQSKYFQNWKDQQSSKFIACIQRAFIPLVLCAIRLSHLVYLASQVWHKKKYMFLPRLSLYTCIGHFAWTWKAESLHFGQYLLEDTVYCCTELNLSKLKITWTQPCSNRSSLGTEHIFLFMSHLRRLKK